MSLLPAALRFALNVNGHAARLHRARETAFDPWPVVKFFNPVGAATWLATEIDADGDTLFGLADLGFGCPELGCFSLAEIAAVRLPFGLGIERDACFDPLGPLSDWTEAAGRLGSISLAEKALLRRKLDRLLPDPSPDSEAKTGGAGS